MVDSAEKEKSILLDYKPVHASIYVTPVPLMKQTEQQIHLQLYGFSLIINAGTSYSQPFCVNAGISKSNSGILVVALSVFTTSRFIS